MWLIYTSLAKWFQKLALYLKSDMLALHLEQVGCVHPPQGHLSPQDHLYPQDYFRQLFSLSLINSLNFCIILTSLFCCHCIIFILYVYLFGLKFHLKFRITVKNKENGNCP